MFVTLSELTGTPCGPSQSLKQDLDLRKTGVRVQETEPPLVGIPYVQSLSERQTLEGLGV